MKKKSILCILMVIILSFMMFAVTSHTVLTVIVSPFIRMIISAGAGILLGFLFNWIILRLIKIIRIKDFTHLILMMICFYLSCICGGLLSIPLKSIPGLIGEIGPIFVTISVFIVSGIIFSYRNTAFSELANRLSNGKIQLSQVSAQHEQTALLDTSVIIDGRIADIAHCGFVPGTLIVPGFILQELQFIADSEDTQRRQRGRRGLETLANMQKDPSIDIQITEFEVPNVREADAKLMHVAMGLKCPILTNDYNLNKVAELQGIRILNINDLTNAVKSILLPGEKLFLNVIQEGKDINQGVGYMEDGTMVVVENGRAFLGQRIEVVVTKILQTAAGRMIFARHEKDLGVKR